MRQQHLFLPTLREIPSEAEAASHRLLLKGGYIRPLASGIYSYLPLGWRVLNKIAGIVRSEMDAVGAQELLLPALQPAELWQRSGRYGQYGPELIRLQDRHGREFALGPTHEEVITALAAGELSSYRQLPLTLYQIQTKFRDERRPRFGLLRGREFLMKDAYSFDASWEGLGETYRRMYEAYERIFQRCGLEFRAVEADAGTIGGEGRTHEFMALADIGEDTVVYCECCGYAANLEKAVSRTVEPVQDSAEAGAGGAGLGITEADSGEESVRAVTAVPNEANSDVTGILDRPEAFLTPGIRTIGELTAAYGLEAGRIIKTLLYVADGRPVAVLVRGDDEVNEIKVKAYLKADTLELADASLTEQVTGAPLGFAGPVGLDVPMLADLRAACLTVAVTGANRPDTHLRGVRPGRDFSLEETGDFRNVKEGEGCPRCGEGRLLFRRGMELGHVFELGTKYSAKLGAVYKEPEGREQHFLMGCYGIGLSRLLSAVVEQHHDAEGILWPESIAPYRVHILPAAAHDAVQMETAEELYRALTSAGVEALLDDRQERAGVKFKDADLIGIPYRVIAGRRAAEGLVEVKVRGDREARLMEKGEAAAFWRRRGGKFGYSPIQGRGPGCKVVLSGNEGSIAYAGQPVRDRTAAAY
ncbi:proline--tRNA ligase [Gorillibacterium sp. sgz5001074]|uniref:proline--tRNA ligase n=1 Tax=Gorillibacterium sp. sgz5001074 TaxID=3446695 RepID=UPI003F674B1B